MLNNSTSARWSTDMYEFLFLDFLYLIFAERCVRLLVYSFVILQFNLSCTSAYCFFNNYFVGTFLDCCRQIA
jgi:hypothetical protein